MNFNIKDRTILLFLVGSRGYGTYNEDSDWDYKGICIAPNEVYLGNNSNFEQYNGPLPGDWHPVDPHESTIYDIKKYFKLAQNCNPNILEILYSNKDFLVRGDSFGQELINNRDLFLSKKARHTYSGYAFAQLKKIRTHRHWLLTAKVSNLETQPTRAKFGLPQQPEIGHDQLKAAISLVDKKIEYWMINPEEEIPVTVLEKARESVIDLMATVLTNKDQVKEELVRAAGFSLGFDSNFSEYIVREKGYKGALNEYNSYQDWKRTRNPKRQLLEERSGYDTKHAMHLVRLLRTCEELLTDGTLLVYRPDAQELKEIRNGSWTYDKLETYAADMDNKIEKLYQNNNKLPYSPDKQAIDKLLIRLIEHFNES